MSQWSTSSDYAKDIWAPTFHSQIVNGEGSFMKLFGFNPEAPTYTLEGRRWFVKIQTGADKGFGVLRTPGADFPTPGDFNSDEAQLDLMRFAEAIQLDGHESALLESLTAGATDSLMRKKMTEARIRVMRELERMSIMDGSGALAKVASASGTAVTLDVAGAAYTERNPYTWIDDANLSNYIGVDPTDGSDQDAAFTVSNVAESTNILTASTDQAALAAGDLIVNYYGAGQFASGGVYSSPEFPGLLALIDDDNTYMGINRASAGLGFWKAVVDGNSGTNRTFTETLANTITNKLGRRAEDQMLNTDDYCAIASPGVYTAYQLNMTGGIRYTHTDTPDIGWAGRSFVLMNGMKLYHHQKAPRNTLLIAHKPSIHYCGAKYDSGAFKFIDNPNGGIWFQSNASTGQGYADSRVAYIAGFIGMYSDRPRNCARLDDLTEASSAY
jgi:hypothetical protein